jgi:hypothetical protein
MVALKFEITGGIKAWPLDAGINQIPYLKSGTIPVCILFA